MMEIKVLPPEEARELVVGFLWRIQDWPTAPREQYYRYIDWRYRSLSDGDARVWLALEGGQVVGHIAAYFRRFRVGETKVRAAIPGHLFVQPDQRNTLAGPRLALCPRGLVRSGEVDLVIAYANEAAHPLFLRTGFREVGLMHTYVDVHRFAPLLRRRTRLLASAGRLIDVAFFVRRALRAKHRRPPPLQVRQLTRDQVRSLDRSHWRRVSDCLVAENQPEYLARRFLDDPFTPISVQGLFDPATARLEGYVALEGKERVKVWDCEVNTAVLDEAAAVARVIRCLPNIETVQVPLLPGSDLAKAFTQAGFLHLRPLDLVEAHTSWSAFWLPDHPLAAVFSDYLRWRLWFGANHY